MIWFNCKRCGKPYSRPDTEAGAVIFCACGQSLTIPWNSTAPPRSPSVEPVRDEADDIPEAIPVLPPMPRPRTVPLPVDDDTPRRPALPVPGRGVPDRLPRKKRRTIKRANPAYCFNHDELASETVCEDCKLSFCSACVVEFQHAMLCGPCKNFRLRDRATPTRKAPAAIRAMIAGFASGPIAFCLSTFPLTLYARGEGSPPLTVLAVLLALILPVVACRLGLLALREIDGEPLLSGRGLALTGTLGGLLGAMWCVTVAILTLYKQTTG